MGHCSYTTEELLDNEVNAVDDFTEVVKTDVNTPEADSDSFLQQPVASEYPKKFVSSKALRDHCSSHQKVESEEENNGPISVKVDLVEHPEEIPIKEEPIKRNEKDTKSPEKTFPCDLCDKYLNTKEALSVHKNIHAEMTKYKCALLTDSITVMPHTR